jgi:tetratricopeptide (TPR) repeat protein
MSNEFDPEDDDAGDATESAAASALALGAASREKADAFLDAQTAIARLQREHLHEQRGLQISHVKWRRFNDWMRSGWQAMLAAIGAVAVVAVATALWNASRANGLVVDAFTVPQNFEHRGIGGEVMAGDMTDRIAAIRAVAVINSYSITNDVSRNRADEIKVEIPDTGISIGEVWRYLRSWLGHERHLSGSLRELEDGRVALSVSLDGAGVFSGDGKLSDLPMLERRAAEDVFGAFDPVNRINYLSAIGRYREAMESAARFVPLAPPLFHADSYALWSYTTALATGDIQTALTRAHVGEAIDPSLAVVHVMAGRMNFYLGHDQAGLKEDRAILTLRNEDQLPSHQSGGFDTMKEQARAQIALLSGDFANALYSQCSHSCTFAHLLLVKSALAARLHDVAVARSLFVQGVAAASGGSEYENDARYYLRAAEGDWNTALSAMLEEQKSDDPEKRFLSPRFLAVENAVFIAPLIAVAQAHLGRFPEAHATIDATPGDCVACETARGDIDALQKNPSGAAFWFSRAIADAPSIPFADADWGEMLLREGQFGAAIAKFQRANAIGPRFADPLEMWGETLMLKNRSDLALAKFEEANKYASDWGRLHLKWGEAMIYVGKKDEAQKQFALASALALSTADKSELTRMSGTHG